jgi:hypothetical protein
MLMNIGLNCRWQTRCMKLQQRSMKRALRYVQSGKASSTKVHRCNRNAARGHARVDWVGFDHCIRNPAMGR